MREGEDMADSLDHIRRGKQLLSRVKQLRGHVGSDPARAAELADALNELTANRLLAHEYDDATEDAQDAVTASARLLTEAGPIGAYTPPPVAARYYTSLTHVAVTQAGLGMIDGGVETLGLLDDFRNRLTRPMATDLAPRTAVWALMTRSHLALATGDVPVANAWADAAGARMAAIAGDDDLAPLVIDTEQATADARWAAGHTAESIAHLRDALNVHARWADTSLEQPARLSPALLWFLIAPLVGISRDLADRLVSLGQADEATAIRAGLVDRLTPMVGRLGADGREMLDELVVERDAGADVSAGALPQPLGAWPQIGPLDALDPHAEAPDSTPVVVASPTPPAAASVPSGAPASPAGSPGPAVPAAPAGVPASPAPAGAPQPPIAPAHPAPEAEAASAHPAEPVGQPGDPAEQALREAEEQLEEARISGRRRSVRDAAAAVVQALRPLAEADSQAWNARLAQALDDLAAARRGVGDLWGARQASREAASLRGR